MSAQDKTEEILRQMHILLAGSEAYDSIGSKIILDKKRMLELLAELNKAIYAMLDEYELTTQCLIGIHNRRSIHILRFPAGIF